MHSQLQIYDFSCNFNVATLNEYVLPLIFNNIWRKKLLFLTVTANFARPGYLTGVFNYL